jgi:phage FluMu protein Com
MPVKDKVRIKKCQHCHKILDRICFTALMTEEWSWTGEGYNENTVRHSLVTDREQNVQCPYCGKVVGTGIDFGF